MTNNQKEIKEFEIAGVTYTIKEKEGKTILKTDEDEQEIVLKD